MAWDKCGVGVGLVQEWRGISVRLAWDWFANGPEEAQNQHGIGKGLLKWDWHGIGQGGTMDKCVWGLRVGRKDRGKKKRMNIFVMDLD